MVLIPRVLKNIYNSLKNGQKRHPDIKRKRHYICFYGLPVHFLFISNIRKRKLIKFCELDLLALYTRYWKEKGFSPRHDDILIFTKIL